MNSTENNNRAASQDFQTALGLLEERLRSLEDSEAIINDLLQGAAEFYGAARASVVEADWDLKIGLLTRSVSNIAYRLRRILSIIDLEDLIVGRHGTFVINPEYNVYTDFDRFEDNCRRMEAEANPKAQSELYQGAVELYRGDLFSKISYQHWLMPKTAYYHNIFLRIIKCYIERKMEQGDYCAAHRAVVDAMSLDPYDSELNTDMILIMYHRGGAELAKSFLQTAEAYMSEEQITFVQQLWERK